MVIVQFQVIWYNNIGLVSLILLGWELHVIYKCTMCIRHTNLVTFAFVSPLIFKSQFLNLLIIMVQVSSYATSSQKIPCHR